MCGIGLLVPVIAVIAECFQEGDVVLELLDLSLHLLPVLLHLNTVVPLMDETVEVFLL